MLQSIVVEVINLASSPSAGADSRQPPELDLPTAHYVHKISLERRLSPSPELHTTESWPEDRGQSQCRPVFMLCALATY